MRAAREMDETRWNTAQFLSKQQSPDGEVAIDSRSCPRVAWLPIGEQYQPLTSFR
jgi:hypothetical protein